LRVPAWAGRPPSLVKLDDRALRWGREKRPAPPRRRNGTPPANIARPGPHSEWHPGAKMAHRLGQTATPRSPVGPVVGRPVAESRNNSQRRKARPTRLQICCSKCANFRRRTGDEMLIAIHAFVTALVGVVEVPTRMRLRTQ